MINVPNNAKPNDTPAKQLVGTILANGWIVDQSIVRPPTATGGTFSASYIVRTNDGRKAFLKAMDYTTALESSDPARALQAMTSAYNFERDVLEKCKSGHLSRIVRVLDAGTLAPAQDNPSSVVQYLIFELADGDVRSFIRLGEAFDTAWALRMMHQVAAALRQLHFAGIAHQDIKPSNILVFKNEPSKLADLGRASDRHGASPFDELPCAGDPTYAPPELLYGEISPDWGSRRLACDMYLLGSIVVFFCTGVSMTHLLLTRLHKNHHYSEWGGDYRDVLPFLEHVFVQIVREFRALTAAAFANDIADLVKHLCHPDPELRGHPASALSKSGRYSLERYVSIFDRLARRAEYSLTRSVLTITNE